MYYIKTEVEQLPFSEKCHANENHHMEVKQFSSLKLDNIIICMCDVENRDTKAMEHQELLHTIV